jgi:hypothetical protein
MTSSNEIDFRCQLEFPLSSFKIITYDIMIYIEESVTCGRSVVFPGTPVSSTNKTDHHDIAEKS